MTRSELTLSRINAARERIDRAIRCWAPTDLNRIAGCRETLRESVCELRELEPLLQQTVDNAFGAGVFVSTSAAAGISAAKIRSGLLGLRNDATHLERLVDSASAFLRGVLLLKGAATPAYTADGRMQAEGETTSSRGMEG
jgi:hypothetical protein